MCTYQMTHWKTKENMSHKKRHQKKGVMSKKQEKAFFGHNFGNVQSTVGKVRTTLTIDDEEHHVTLYPDKNGNICDISGLNKDNGCYDKELGEIPSDYNYAMNILRGQAITLWK